jgi:hypothetical protein
MWVKLIEIIETQWDKNQQPRHRAAKAVNTLYGAMHNCYVAFARHEDVRTETSFANFVLAIDALISTLQNLNPQLALFDPALADRLEHYALGEARTTTIAQPRETVKTQLRLLRELVDIELDAIALPTEEFGSFSDAIAHLGRFIENTFTLDELFGTQGGVAT